MAVRERLDKTLDRCIRSIETWQQLINENFEDEQSKNQEMDKLKSIVKDYCEIDQIIEKTDKALIKVDEEVNALEEPTDITMEKLFKQHFENEPTSSMDNHQNSSFWKKVFGHNSDVIEVKQRKHKLLDDTQYEELGDSMMCSNVFTPPIDPISKVVVREPYKNKRCKHVYEYTTIVGYIKQLKNKAKCPYIGCNNHQLRVSDLVADNALQSEITQYLETQQQQEDEEEESDE